MKKCSKCGEVKTLSEFYKDKNRKDGFRSKCKCCIKAYYEANRDKKMKEQIENILNTNKQQTKEIESLKKLSQEKESNLKELSDKYEELKEKQAKNTVSFLWGLIKITFERL